MATVDHNLLITVPILDLLARLPVHSPRLIVLEVRLNPLLDQIFVEGIAQRSQ